MDRPYMQTTGNYWNCQYLAKDKILNFKLSVESWTHLSKELSYTIAKTFAMSNW